MHVHKVNHSIRLLANECIKRTVYTRRIKVKAFIKCSFFKQTAFNSPLVFVISKAVLNTVFYRDFRLQNRHKQQVSSTQKQFWLHRVSGKNNSTSKTGVLAQTLENKQISPEFKPDVLQPHLTIGHNLSVQISISVSCALTISKRGPNFQISAKVGPN